jgi:carboxypeptidase T
MNVMKLMSWRLILVIVFLTAFDLLFAQNREELDPEVRSEIPSEQAVDPLFHNYSEIVAKIEYYKTNYPEIVQVEKIGTGSVYHLPIWAIKISDNPYEDEAEPAILFTALHHAKELLGSEVCLYLLDYLCKNYAENSKVRQWVNDLEIWIVPVVNPDGLYLAIDSKFAPQFWRKNLSDNNSNGRFDAEKDGVDLNRNYDFNWASEGDNDSRSWYYRGPFPFSEEETQAIRDLTYRERFVFHLDFHSYGEVILYPWDNFTTLADQRLIIDLAKEMAKGIQKNGQLARYSISALNGKLGQSSVWMRGKMGILSYIIEVGDSHFPKGRELPEIIAQGANAAFYAIDRMYFSSIEGIVRDAYSKIPISAEINITEYNSPVAANPLSDPKTGYFFRITQPGSYSIKISAPGYRTKMIKSVDVSIDRITKLNIEMFPREEPTQTEN